MFEYKPTTVWLSRQDIPILILVTLDKKKIYFICKQIMKFKRAPQIDRNKPIHISKKKY